MCAGLSSARKFRYAIVTPALLHEQQPPALQKMRWTEERLVSGQVLLRQAFPYMAVRWCASDCMICACFPRGIYLIRPSPQGMNSSHIPSGRYAELQRGLSELLPHDSIVHGRKVLRVDPRGAGTLVRVRGRASEHTGKMV